MNNLLETSPNLRENLANANIRLNINSALPIIFVYTAPKVGSTSMVSSLRIFGIDKFNIIHIHDEIMLSVLKDIRDITINNIILYNAHIGHTVYVIDIYRNPIEHKISYFFEHIGYHFNNTDENINNYDINRLIKRFNQVFPFINTTNYFIEQYNLSTPLPEFDHSKKYAYADENGVKYIAVRLTDSDKWGDIISSIIGHKIMTIKDYETKNKIINSAYRSFIDRYKLPDNFADIIATNKNINYFLSPDEKKKYLNTWSSKLLGGEFEPFDNHQYEMYNEITIENAHFTHIQQNHYVDDGCTCKACAIKRRELVNSIINGKYSGGTNHHVNSLKEFKQNRSNLFCSRIQRLCATSKPPTNKSISKGIMTKIVGK